MNYKVISDFEYEGESYKEGSEFQLPKGWNEDMLNFHGQGIRFTVPFEFRDEATNEKTQSFRWLILPLAHMTENSVIENVSENIATTETNAEPVIEKKAKAKVAKAKE